MQDEDVTEDVTAGHSEDELAPLDDILPTSGLEKGHMVGLGGSAGGIEALQAFFANVQPDSGLTYVVVLHLSPEHESRLAELLQRVTPLPVVQVNDPVKVEAGNVYVIPPGKLLRVADGYLRVIDLPPRKPRHVTVDMFFRTLADSYGQHAVAIVLSGADGDGAIGIKRIKERGGLTIAQDPQEAQFPSMPRTAIETGMVDWVLPAGSMAKRVEQYRESAARLRLPSEVGPQPAQPVITGDAGVDEHALREVLAFMRTRTGRDLSYYKRATILRRIARRMQVNATDTLAQYLDALRQRPGEAGALLQDLLISVTNFFRDAHSFEALTARLPVLFEGKGNRDFVRVWVAACATGEEAYSLAMLLSEHARTLAAPPLLQIFATDLDTDAIQVAREGLYPFAIETDVSEERLHRNFTKEHNGYRVRRELREMVLFAAHDVLKDSPFSRLDLVSCRNLLIYLTRSAQQRVIETFHFALQPNALMFLGTSESVDDRTTLYATLDKKNRIFAQRPAQRPKVPPLNTGPSTLALAMAAQGQVRDSVVTAGRSFDSSPTVQSVRGNRLPDRSGSWSELHLKLLEQLTPPSVLVDSEYDIVHVSQSAGRFLQYGAGEHSRNLLRVVHLALRIELRAALVQCAQSGASVTAPALTVEVNGREEVVTLSVTPGQDLPGDYFVVVFDTTSEEVLGEREVVPRPLPDAASHQLERELERLKNHLRDNMEQHEASTEELKASNEELQAMNEELRSATEELETGREELQSINEELTTVNHELKSKVDELGHANSDMHNLMDATAIATIFLDRQLCITRYTPSAVALFNLIPSDLGRPLTDLNNQLQYPELDDDARRVLERLVPIEREVSQGDSSWYLSRLLPYRTLDDRIAGVVLSFVNISARKLAEQALQYSEERMRLVLDNAHEYAIFTTNTAMEVTGWNPGAQRLLGYSEAEMLGESAELMFTPEDRAAGVPEQEIQLALEEGRAGDDRFHQRKDGSRFWASGALMSMRDAAGNVAGFVKILRDQTAERDNLMAQKRSQEELTQALLQTERARKELEKADAAKDRFIAVLSHELRNPLASIASAAELMASPQVENARRDEAVKVLRRQALNMKLLMDDLLDTSRLTLGRFTLHTQPVGLATVLQNAVDATRPLLDAADHTLTCRLPEPQVTANADALRLTQVVVNLLSNAAKYTPPGGRISLDCEVAAQEACIVVRDNGTGMDAAEIEHMFEMFTQGSNAGGPKGGLGIGLALARSIVEMHGGRITASSAGVGLGCEFRVLLPLVPPPAQLLVPAAERRKRGPRVASQCIVLADDNKDGAWTLAELLKAAGHTVHVAHNGQQALQQIEEHRPSVAVLDIGMPILDGYEVARHVREQAWGHEVMLIAATGWGQESDQRNAAQAGFFAHLTKPVDLVRLYQLIDSVSVINTKKSSEESVLSEMGS